MPKHPLPGLLLLVSIGAISCVVFTPALPIISSYFSVSTGQGEVMVGAALLGYALGQLPYGPITNRFGDRIALIIGMTLAIAGLGVAALTYYVVSYTLLLVALFTSGLGTAVGLKVTFHFIPTYYEHNHARQIASFMFVSAAFAPYLSVTVSGFVVQYLGWPASFLFFALYLVIVFFVARFTLRPTSTQAWDTLHLRRVLKGYSEAVCSPLLVTCAGLWGFSLAIIYTFAAHAPSIGIGQLGLTPSSYGLWALVSATGFGIGSLVSSLLSRQIATMTLIYSGLSATALGVITMLILFSFGLVSSSTLFLPTSLIYLGLGPIAANASVTAMRDSQDRSNASAMNSFLTVMIAFFSVLIVDRIDPKSAIALPVMFAIYWVILASLTAGLAFLIKKTQ